MVEILKGVATKPVSLFYQTLFVFIIDVIAFYRIKKLRRFLLILVIPGTIITSTISSIFTDYTCEPDWMLYMIYDTCQSFELQIITSLIYAAYLVFSIYLIRKWSIQWNKQFER